MKYIITLAFLMLSSFISFSEIINENEAAIKVIVKSPPIIYGNTVDMGIIIAGEKNHAGCLIENKGRSPLIIERTTSSDSRLKCKVWIDSIPPQASVSVWGIAKFEKPTSNFKIKTEIYWKNIKKPTIVYFTGKVIKKD